MRIGRNDPCPCGSGKKYKKCCGKNDNVISINEAQITKEQDLLIQAFFTYLFENWSEQLIDDYFEVKHTPPPELDEALEDDDYIILSEAFAFHKKVKGGMTPFELFINKNSGNFRSATISHFRKYFDMYYSFYRVTEINSDVIVLEDCLLKKTHQVLKEDLLVDLEKGDILLCQLTNNDGVQKVFLNFFNFGGFAGPYLEDVINLYKKSELGFEEFLQENSYSIVKTILVIDNEQDESAENLRYEEEYLSKYLFATTWLITPQEFLGNNIPVEAFRTLQGKKKIIRYLTTLDDPSLLSHEKELLVLSKEIIEEHLGINPKINGTDHYSWENSTYQKVAEKIEEDSLRFFTPYQLAQGVKMWFDYANIKKPRILKEDTWVAAINYALLQIEFAPRMTQEQLAEKYSISAATLGKNYRELKKYLNIEDYRTAEICIPFQFNDLFDFVNENNLAEVFIDQAWETEDPEERITLAKRAIEVDSDSVDAYVILGNEAEYWDEALKYYKLGVQAGERSLGEEYFRENQGHFWGLLETRPYMRAKYGLAEALWELGKKAEAVKHLFDMLELNPNDNQGVRYILCNHLLLVGEDEKLEDLFHQYTEDVGVFFSYNYALFLFKRYGDVPESQEALKKAMQYNKYVPEYLLTTKKITESQPPYFSLGSKEEAISYVLEAKDVWKRIPGSLKWLQRYLWFC